VGAHRVLRLTTAPFGWLLAGFARPRGPQVRVEHLITTSIGGWIPRAVFNTLFKAKLIEASRTRPLPALPPPPPPPLPPPRAAASATQCSARDGGRRGASVRVP